MFFLKSLFNTVTISAIFFAVTSCVPKATEKKANCGVNQAFNTSTRSCVSTSELRQRPVGTKSSVTMSEEVPLKVELTYTDGNNNSAVACSVTPGSSNLEIVSPALFNSKFYNEIDIYYASAVLLASYIPVPDFATGDTYKLAMTDARNRLKAALNPANIITQTDILLARADDIISLAGAHLSVSIVSRTITQTTSKRTTFVNYYDQFKNRCECSTGTCYTYLIPKQNQFGTGDFTYTISDLDGESEEKSVSVSIAARSRITTGHLKPVAASGSASGAESNTATAVGFPVNIPEAADTNYPISSSTFTYGFDGTIIGSGIASYGQTLFGKLTDCMGLSGSAANDRTCTYTPNNGDTFDTIIFSQASATIGGLLYTAVANGTVGANVSIQYFDLQTANPSIDAPNVEVSRILPFSLTSLATNESFIRVEGNAIKVFIHPNVTSEADIENLINSDPQANRLVLVSGGLSSVFPDPVVETLLPVNLTGGTDGYDSFSFRANNTFANSVNTAKMTIKITGTNDAPRVPAEIMQVVPDVTILETAVGQTAIFNFRDVDSFATAFTINAALDSLACTTVSAAPAYVALATNPILTTTPLTLAFDPLAPSVPVCDLAGDCTFNVTLSKTLPFLTNDYDREVCLYYTVTDLSGATSTLAQAVKIKVTPINDVPIISVLPSADYDEDSAGFTTLTVDSGSIHPFELDQTMDVTLSSSVPTLIPNVVCKDYTAATTAPTPTAVGQYYLNTTGTEYKCYVSTGTTVSDWKLYPSLTAIPVCPYTLQSKGPPSGTPTAANLHHLDTKNNICYKSSAVGATFVWSKNTEISEYKIASASLPDISGNSTITITVKDSGGVTNGGIDTATTTFVQTVLPLNDAPYILTKFASVETNEGGAIQSSGVVIDEDFAATADEDVQNIIIKDITTDNTNVLPKTSISFFFDENDNGIRDAGETLYSAASLPSANLDSDSTKDFKRHKLYFKLDPVDGISGNANVTVTFEDTDLAVTVPAQIPLESSFTFAFIVHPIAALHNGWKNITSVGIKTNKLNSPVSAKLATNNKDVAPESDIKCNYDTTGCSGGESGAQCLNVTSPHNVVTPIIADAIYWDRSNKTCYRNTVINDKFSWVEFNTTCPLTRIVGFCDGVNCIKSTDPTTAGVIPTALKQYAYDTTANKCYVSTGLTVNDWIEYNPSKVNLEWKPFTIVGSGSFNIVSVASHRIYRREAGEDFDFSATGHIGSVASNVYKYTDNTALSGKVYYYLVRPVDSIKSFPTFTPEVYSEVRVVASPNNNVFVHRWMMNQEVCNSMNITQTTSPNFVDPTNNFRCQYQGPGETDVAGIKYYDSGADLFVDLQELGCAYAPAPKCGANGCVGMGNPVASGASAALLTDHDLYYDRSNGKCYVYDSGTVPVWNEIETYPGVLASTITNKLVSALNAPVVNITQTRAAAICSSRDAPVTDLVLPSPVLPNKKQFIAYSASRYDITDSQITPLEEGFSLNAYSRCNSSSASGLEAAYVDAAIPSTTFIFSLPGTSSSLIRSMVTGSVPSTLNYSTEACTSRYGIQDLYGNVAEWTTDRMQCSAADLTCTSQGLASSYSTFDFGVNDFYGFNLETGPYNDSNGITPGPEALDTYLTSWTFADELYEAGKFSFPMGLPINVNIDRVLVIEDSPAIPYILDIGPVSGITTAKLHEDSIIVNGAAVNAGATDIGAWAVGGGYKSGNGAGRFSMELIEASTARSDVGLRCVVPVDKALYPIDSRPQYNYSY